MLSARWARAARSALGHVVNGRREVGSIDWRYAGDLISVAEVYFGHALALIGRDAVEKHFRCWNALDVAFERWSTKELQPMDDADAFETAAAAYGALTSHLNMARCGKGMTRERTNFEAGQAAAASWLHNAILRVNQGSRMPFVVEAGDRKNAYTCICLRCGLSAEQLSGPESLLLEKDFFAESETDEAGQFDQAWGVGIPRCQKVAEQTLDASVMAALGLTPSDVIYPSPSALDCPA